ncbi:MAG: phage major capsid protein [Phycisphaerales bacterium]|nr:phage major capsid protein [Phycisphaerales bacterium]
MALKDLHAKRAKALADARAIHEKAKKEGRDLSAEEREQYDRAVADMRSAKADIEREKAQHARDRELEIEDESIDEIDEPRAGREDPTGGGEDDEDDRPSRRGDGGRGRERRRGDPEDRGGRLAGTEPRTLSWRFANGRTRRVQVGGELASGEYRQAHDRYLRTSRMNQILARVGMRDTDPQDREERDLYVENDTQAGYLVAPQTMAAGMIKFVDDAVFVRQYATVYAIPTSKSLGAVSLDADPDDGEWTAECKTGSADTAMKFGRRQLNPSRLSKSILLSRDLLRMAPDVEGLVIERLGYKVAVTHEKNFLTGDGAEKPLGLFVASNDGIPTSRDVSTGNTTTEVKADNLIRVKQSLKQQYRNRAVWMFHRDVVTKLLLMKDANGQYIWRQGLTAGDPDTLLARPVIESEFAPNTMTTGKYVGLFGDLSFYWIADGLDMIFQVSDDRYILEDKRLVIVRSKTDGMPVLAEAFARVKLG